ncbi:hypothetical protein I3843_05G223200 [Carya illinoinensis]|uniref:Plastid movement impaired 2 n=1 Tax=Carya illinoinensis TaxID=32201 RepID=A0A922JSD0_CARIL|nr:hypothetical protein I3760_05G244500 [Carya illinoinensis]KAG6715239.1 hypothetical protein I3842_05G241100 [Carya illinoinensis]KAG7981241.1 hypothetical protein I3843_05G223200 [Carya illinoinensis]
MGNSLGSKKTAKVIKINGETLKLKTPVQAGEVVKDYPGHVLLDSEAVKHYGIRAKPLEPHQLLEPRRLYFLVELPQPPKETVPRRVRSGINMSAKDRLESLMLSRRSVSDLSIMKPTSIALEESKEGSQNGAVRLKMRLPKAEVEKLMRESKDEAEAAEKIMNLCRASNGDIKGGREVSPKGNEADREIMALEQKPRWEARGHGRVGRNTMKGREKRVSFMPINEGEIQIAVAAS